MRKTRNVAPTNMDSLFDAAPYEKTPLSKLPIDMQAEIICGCGFYGLQAADVDNNQTETEPTVLSFEDGPSVSLKKRAKNLISANYEISNRNMAEGRVKQDNFKYGEPMMRYNTANMAAKKHFEKAFGVDELVAGGMSRADAIAMSASAFKDYDKEIGGKGSEAKKRVKLNKVQQKILELFKD